jgi:hypothetical protein
VDSDGSCDCFSQKKSNTAAPAKKPMIPMIGVRSASSLSLSLSLSCAEEGPQEVSFYPSTFPWSNSI